MPAFEDVVQPQGLHELLLSLHRLWRDRDPRPLGNPVHHLEIAEDSGGVDEGLVPESLENPVASDLPVDPRGVEEGIHQGDELAPPRDSDIDGRIRQGFDLNRVSEMFAAPPEPPPVGEHSVEALVEHGDPPCHGLQLWCVQAGMANEARVGHLLLGHVEGPEEGTQRLSLTRDEI